VGEEYLIFNIILHAKSEQNVIGIDFVHQNQLKTGFSLKIYLLQFMSGELGCNIYFLFEQQAFNGLLKVIGKQK
jgi:hypothetical protein